MKGFLKWTAISVGCAAGATVLYKSISAARQRLERGLEHVERIAEDAQNAVAHTQEALGQTARTIREVRHTVS